MRSQFRALLWALLLVVLGSSAGQAQGGIQNFPLQRQLSSPPIRLFSEAGLELFADQAEAHTPELRQIAAQLGVANPAPVELYLLRHKRFTALTSHSLPEWGVGYCGWPGGPVVIDAEELTRGSKTFLEVLRHEFSHAYLGQSLANSRPPRWFVEGVAQAQSGEWRLGDALGLVGAAGTGGILTLSEIAGQFPSDATGARLAYRISVQAVNRLQKDLLEQGGWSALVAEAARTGDFEVSFAGLLGQPMREWQSDFEGSLQLRYGWFAALVSGGSLFFLMALIFLVASARAYLKKNRRMKEMQAEEWAAAMEAKVAVQEDRPDL